MKFLKVPSSVYVPCKHSLLKHLVSLPPDIQLLIDAFADLFEVPAELPPVRDCDHQIPLVEGASPVVV